MIGGEVVPAETEFALLADGAGRDDGFGGCGELAEESASGGGLEVEGDAALVGVEEEVQSAQFAVGLVGGEGAAAADWVAAGGRLDFYQVCAEVGEQLAGVGGGDAAAVFEDAEALEGAGRSGLRRGVCRRVRRCFGHYARGYLECAERRGARAKGGAGWTS